jgi:hypothetical protein
MGSEGVTEGMRRGGLMDAARQHGPAHGAAAVEKPTASPIPQGRWDTFWLGRGEVPPGHSRRPDRPDECLALSAGAV